MKTATTISISTPLYKAAKSFAARENRSFSGQLETWLEEKFPMLKTPVKVSPKERKGKP